MICHWEDSDAVVQEVLVNVCLTPFHYHGPQLITSFILIIGHRIPLFASVSLSPSGLYKMYFARGGHHYTRYSSRYNLLGLYLTQSIHAVLVICRLMSSYGHPRVPTKLCAHYLLQYLGLVPLEASPLNSVRRLFVGFVTSDFNVAHVRIISAHSPRPSSTRDGQGFSF